MKENNLANKPTSIEILRKKLAEISIFCSPTDMRTRIDSINHQLEESNDWDWNKSQLLILERSRLENLLQELANITDSINYFTELIEIADLSLAPDITKSLHKLEKNIDDLAIKCIFDEQLDHCNAFIDIKAGSGGLEAQDWASMLLTMYFKWAVSKNFCATTINLMPGDGQGIRNVTLKVNGNYVYGWFKSETGIHRLVRKSPFDANHKRHTSFASVFVYPQIDKTIELTINPNDLRIDTFRSSGAGGQHVNKTDSAVRITHLPTNIVVQCQNDRSQHKNKELAMSQLKSKLYQLELKHQAEEKQALEESKSSISWGNQIRSYILDQSRIKDLRTGLESGNIQAILNGDLDFFIFPALKKIREEKSARKIK